MDLNIANGKTGTLKLTATVTALQTVMRTLRRNLTETSVLLYTRVNGQNKIQVTPETREQETKAQDYNTKS